MADSKNTNILSANVIELRQDRLNSLPLVVGIGASAGGLKAIGEMLSSIPAEDSNIWVIVQHLDPHRPGMLPTLLQGATTLPIREVKERTILKAGHIYIAPPNKEICLHENHLCLYPPSAPHGQWRPINAFFHSLAVEKKESAIGVVLSGMGDDGTLGVSEIRTAGGYSIIQTPENAQFDAMPRSAISSGQADIIAPAQDIPSIVQQFRNRMASRNLIHPTPQKQMSVFDEICMLLKEHTGHDFVHYKKSTVYRRIERRLTLHQISKITDYPAFLKENPQEVDLLFKELLIGVTSFFRDSAAWESLINNSLPGLIEKIPTGGTLRAWVAGCSTGEEAYTLAISIREVMQNINPPPSIHVQIFATDLDPDAIFRARQGTYTASQINDCPPSLRARYFSKEAGGFRIRNEIREMLIFAPQNVIMDPPFTRLDLLTCRNLMIYLDTELQRKLLPIFHYSLKPGGVLFLGCAESLGPYGPLFETIDSKSRIYRRGTARIRPTELEFPTRLLQDNQTVSGSGVSNHPTVNLQAIADQLLLKKFAPAAVLVNSSGDILFIHGRTGKFLEPAAGKANWNVHAMAKDGLRQEIALALPKVLQSLQALTIPQISYSSNGQTEYLDLIVIPGDDAIAPKGMIMLTFQEVQPEPKNMRRSRQSPNVRMSELELALKQAREEIQKVREEMQTSSEKLKAANEDLQSANEELQSANEELTTSKEEMQSLNEELQTVNAELQAKVDELSAAYSDMKNLLNSTDIATVFLDNQLHIRRFTNQATRIFKLISGDVGRPLSDIVCDLDYPELLEDAQEVLRSLAYSEKQLSTNDNRWYVAKIMPYRTLDNVIDGVVITFIDISEAKHLEQQLRVVKVAQQQQEKS